jgi:hypothetical protein
VQAVMLISLSATSQMEALDRLPADGRVSSGLDINLCILLVFGDVLAGITPIHPNNDGRYTGTSQCLYIVSEHA